MFESDVLVALNWLMKNLKKILKLLTLYSYANTHVYVDFMMNTLYLTISMKYINVMWLYHYMEI